MKILKFAADWCGPCKELSKWLATKDHDHEIVEINIEGNKEMCEHYGIRGVPTMVMLNNDDTVRKTIVGFNIPKVEQFLQI